MLEFDQQLYEILKPLLHASVPTGKSPVQLFKNDMVIDKNSAPKDFVIYRTDISNVGWLYGDGKPKIRQSACDVLVVESGDGNDANSGYLVKLVEEQLIKNNVHYRKISSYYHDMDNMQTVFDFYLYI